MGSWNGTCGISQLPIMEGDKVALFFLIKQRGDHMDFNGCVNPDSLFEPVSPAIFAEYADYGQVRNVSSDIRIIRETFGTQESYSDIGKIIEEMCSKKEVYFMLVHLDLYEKIIKKYGNEKYFYTEDLSLKEFMKKEMFDYIEVHRSEKDIPIELDYNEFKMGLNFKMKSYYNEKLYFDNLEEDPLMNNVLDFIIFKNAMIVSRKLWSPQAGQGHQERDFEMAKIIGKFAIKKDNEDY